MKIGNPSCNPDFEVTLPAEIIDLILAYISAEKPSRAKQRLLWCCSLVSKSWYFAAVPLLYEAPILSGKNFDEFTRTLCPPLKERKTLTGLKHYVKHLNMGHLAYETRKSITARLISNTKQNLETFTAPAVSFSINCLAPLSKCANLKYLDMSSDAYDIPIAQLLSSLKSLKHLWYLSLPKRAIGKYTSQEDLINTKNVYYSNIEPLKSVRIWPPNLKHLTLNNDFPMGTEIWTFLSQSFPSSLDTISLLSIDAWDIFGTARSFFSLATQYSDFTIPQIRTLKITCDVVGPNRWLPIDLVTLPFPNLQTLNVSGCSGWCTNQFPEPNLAIHAPVDTPAQLQHLILSYAPAWPGAEHLSMYDLKQLARACPRLIRIDVPEPYLKVNFPRPEDEDLEARRMDELDEMLAGRFAQMTQSQALDADASPQIVVKESGVFLVEVDPGAFGLKRSLRYEGEE